MKPCASRAKCWTRCSTLAGDSRSDIAIVRNGGRGPVELLVATRFEESFPDVAPEWGPDGRELFYREPVTNGVMLTSATLSLAPRLAVTARKQLFDVTQMSTTAPHSNDDISPDGRTFALVRQMERGEQR